MILLRRLKEISKELEYINCSRSHCHLWPPSPPLECPLECSPFLTYFFYLYAHNRVCVCIWPCVFETLNWRRRTGLFHSLRPSRHHEYAAKQQRKQLISRATDVVVVADDDDYCSCCSLPAKLWRLWNNFSSGRKCSFNHLLKSFERKLRWKEIWQ